MSADVAELDLGDDATLERLVALQRASYAVEAELIGAALLQLVEDRAPGRVGERPEHVAHPPTIGKRTLA